MERLDLNLDWQFSRLGEETQSVSVSLPHDAMLREPRTIESAGGVNSSWFEGHDYHYTKTLYVPKAWQEKVALLEFEGVYHRAEVQVRGEKAGERPYGYTNFYVPLDDFLRYGEDNEISVIARNSDQPNSRWYSGAGLYRPVWLWLGPKNYIPPNGVKIRTTGIDPPEVGIRVETVGDGPVEVTLYDGKTVIATLPGQSNGGTALFRAVLPDAKLWSPERPKLYRCVVRFGEDVAETNFGIRTLHWNVDSGLTMNGQRVILRGACIHHDNGLLGACCYPDAVTRKVRLLRENGYNAIRSAHNPCSKAILDTCDRLGMLVMDEYIDHWYIHKTEHDYVTDFPTWWKQDLTDMVEKDYNHPCVILYSTGNEVSETAQQRGIVLTGELTEFLHSLDDSRPVTCGVNIFFNFLSTVGFGVYSDKKAKQEAEAAEKRKAAGKAPKKKAAVGSQFFNDLAGILGSGLMKAGATLRGSDRSTRDAFARMDIAGYNYGILRYKYDLKAYPDRLILGSETFCSDAAVFWRLAKKNPRIIGDFVWAGIDYLGEVGVGAWEYSDYAPDFDHGPGWISAGSGRIDLTGYPLAEADYTRVAFGLERGPIIAVRPVNHAGERHSPSAWKMTDAIRSWTWTGCEGKTAEVEVYARASRVDLLLNGKFVGQKSPGANRRVSFPVRYEPGTLCAIARDSRGRKVGQTILKTAEPETILLPRPEEKTVQAGHLSYVWLLYADRMGEVKPMERGRIRVTMAKNGNLLALGNACPYNVDGYLGRETDTYYGRALAILRADGNGPLTLAVSDGTREASVEIPLAED